MKPINAKRERGAALLAMLAVIMLAASWYLVSRLNADSGVATATRKVRNAEVLNRAKQALIGYVAMQAANSGEDNPGALPCPEAAGYFDNPDQEGQTASSCTLPKVGRFPWRTIGTEKLVDSAGEPLWYVVSLGWARTSGNTNINSNSIGQLTVDGAATTPVASPGIVNFTAHGLTAGDAVSFTTGGTLPTGITAGTTYYVITAGLTADAFEIATALGGSAINFTGTSSGTHNVYRNPFGTANSTVALIIAPGPAFTVAAATGCTAFNQIRPTTGTLDWRNYLECENATYPTPDATFVTSGPSGSFNDQVVRVTVADIMPAIEAAIANRIEREIVPALKTVFTPATWGFSGSNPVLPFAAPWPTTLLYGPGPGTIADPSSDYKGVTAPYKGLLPFNQTQGCTTNPADPRCTTTPGAFLVFSKSGNDIQTGGLGTIRTQSTCSWQSDVYVCTGEYLLLPISVTFSLNVTNVAMGLRALDLSKVTCSAVDDVGNGLPTQSVACSVTVALQTNGSAILTVATNALPDIVASGWGTYANYKISIDRAAIGDHALLSSTDSTTGWFVRNEWYRLTYYAVAAGHTAGTLPPACITGTNCLSVVNVTPTDAQHAILILAGRSINGSSRPHPDPANYLEAGNATGAFMRNTVSASPAIPVAQRFNDRIVVIGSNP